MRRSARAGAGEAARQAAEAAQRAARAAEESDRLRAAIDSLPLGVVVADGAGSVVFRNRLARDLSESRGAEVLAAALVDDLLVSAHGGRSQCRTLELHGPPPRTLEVTAGPLRGEAGAAGALAVIEDVTERRHLEAVRRDFVANVSHELRTPVGALSVLAETLADAEDTAVVRRLAARISGEVERAARMIDDLLDLSRIEAEGAGSARTVEIASVVGSALERVAPGATRREVGIELSEIPAGSAVAGDEAQLVSALANLLDNAVKYSDPGSTVEVGVRAAAGMIEISVTDHGIGIPTRDLDRIFERFYRVDRARSRHTGGTGLGLAIVRHVAANHGGEVRVASREGEGSTFTLCIPEERRS